MLSHTIQRRDADARTMQILDAFLAQLAKHERKTTVARRRPTNRNARNVKRQIETNNQRTRAYGLQNTRSTNSARESTVSCGCASFRSVCEMFLPVGTSQLNVSGG